MEDAPNVFKQHWFWRRFSRHQGIDQNSEGQLLGMSHLTTTASTEIHVAALHDDDTNSAYNQEERKDSVNTAESAINGNVAHLEPQKQLSDLHPGISDALNGTPLTWRGVDDPSIASNHAMPASTWLASNRRRQQPASDDPIWDE